MDNLFIAYQKLKDMTSHITEPKINITYDDFMGEIKVSTKNEKNNSTMFFYIFRDNLKDFKDEKDIEIYICYKIIFLLLRLLKEV